MSEIDDLKAQLDSLKFENSRKTEKISELREELATQRKSHDDLDKDYRTLKFDVNDKTTALQKEIDKRSAEALRYKLMMAEGVPPESAVMITADKEEDIKAQIEYIKKFTGKTTPNIPKPGGQPGTPTKSNPNQKDWREIAEEWGKEKGFDRIKFGDQTVKDIKK